MKATKLQTIWIIIVSIYLTGLICLKSIFKGLTGKINRAWVDKTMYKWTNQILNLVKVKVEVINPLNVKVQPGKPTIIMCNHSSLYDIPVSIKALPNTSLRMLSKKEMAKIPLMGPAMRAAEFPFVDRKNRTVAIKNLEYVKQLLHSGIVMWIAPEGTRSKDGKLANFKKGAFITAIESGATIIPIGIRGAFQILPAKTYQFNIHQTAYVHIGEPVEASKFTLNNKEELIEKVYLSMKKLVGES